MRPRFGWSMVFGALLFLATLKIAAQETPAISRDPAHPALHKLGCASEGLRSAWLGSRRRHARRRLLFPK